MMLYLLETENLLKKNGKGRDSAAESYRLKYEAAGLIFLFGYVGNIRVFDTFGDWRNDEKRRKKRGSAAGFTCFKHRKYQGFCFFSKERLREKEGKEEGFSFSLFFPLLW